MKSRFIFISLLLIVIFLTACSHQKIEIKDNITNITFINTTKNQTIINETQEKLTKEVVLEENKCIGEDVFSSVADCYNNCDESLGFKCSQNFKTGCFDCIYQEVVLTFPMGGICGLNLNCPQPRKNCKLSGSTYINNNKVMFSWGEKPNKEGYTYISSITKNQSCDDILSCFYSCNSQQTPETECRYNESCGIAKTNENNVITECSGDACSFEITSQIQNLLINATTQQENTTTENQNTTTKEEQNETQEIMCDEPEFIECMNIGKFYSNNQEITQQQGQLTPQINGYVRLIYDEEGHKGCVYDCSMPVFTFSEECINDENCNEVVNDPEQGYLCYEGPCIYDPIFGIELLN